jgi:uncharacterized protein YbjT (DUF2867 family)
MKILIFGGNGFIGSRIASAARAAGHEVVVATRRAAGDDVNADFLAPATNWAAIVSTADAVINAVGVLRASARDHQKIHADSPAAIAATCAALKKPFLHISALGLDRAKDTPYFRSKRAGEEAIRAANAAAILLRPSVIFGSDSDATKLLLLQAGLPLLPLPRHTGAIAPIHVDDVAALVLCLIGTVRALGCDVDAVGPASMSMGEYIATLRHACGHGRALTVTVPNALLRGGFHATACLGARTMVPEALDLLEHTHTGDARMFVRWMRRLPRDAGEFLPAVCKAPLGATSH